MYRPETPIKFACRGSILWLREEVGIWAYILTALRTAVSLSSSEVYPLICRERKALQVAFLSLA